MENTEIKYENIELKSYEWIKNAIESSNNPFHIDCCKKLVELYTSKFPNSMKEAELLLMIYDKSNQINYI
jgi:hypothetical protein